MLEIGPNLQSVLIFAVGGIVLGWGLWLLYKAVSESSNNPYIIPEKRPMHEWEIKDSQSEIKKPTQST